MELFVLAEAHKSSIQPFIHTFSITAYPMRGGAGASHSYLRVKFGGTPQTSHQFIAEPKLIIVTVFLVFSVNQASVKFVELSHLRSCSLTEYHHPLQPRHTGDDSQYSA